MASRAVGLVDGLGIDGNVFCHHIWRTELKTEALNSSLMRSYLAADNGDVVDGTWLLCESEISILCSVALSVRNGISRNKVYTIVFVNFIILCLNTITVTAP